MAIFVLFSVLSPRRRLYPPACKPYGLEAKPEAAGFRLRRTDVRLPVPLYGDRKPLCGLDQNKNCSFLNCTPMMFIFISWTVTHIQSSLKPK
jgi:hypothetical protein